MQEILRLAIRNCLRHRLRTMLTILGITVAMAGFVFIRTFIEAWYAGVKTTAKNRLVVRNAVSLIFPLPISYFNTITQVAGVEKAGYGNWFGGIYKDEQYSSFQQFAINSSYLDLYPELIINPLERLAWESNRQGALIGRQMAAEYGFKVGDIIQLKGTIFPGLWEFEVQGIFAAKSADYDTRLMFLHWDYLNERNRTEINRQPDHVGFYVVKVQDGFSPAEVAKAIDERFANSYAETLTESETVFVQGFISMLATIITALNIISIVVILIMLLVMTNTMLMSMRERYVEYAIMKSLGFEARHLYALLLSEALLISLSGFGLLSVIMAIAFSLPPQALLGDLAKFFPNITLTPFTVGAAFCAALVVAAISGSLPAYHITKLRVTEALRYIA